MNYNNNFSPILSLIRGQSAADNIARAQAEGMALADQNALREASVSLGSMPYYAGFEGEEGAQRPNFLRKLYEQGNVKEAMELEKFLTSSLGVNRDIRKAGEIELAKKKADALVYGQMIRDFMGGDGPGMNMFGRAIEGEGAPAPAPTPAPAPAPAVPAQEAPTEEAPTIPGPPSAPAARVPLDAYSGVESQFEVTPYGPKLSFKKMSPFEKQLKGSEDESRRQNTQTGVEAERRQTIQAAHENVRKIKDEIINVQKLMQNREIPWDQGQSEIAELSKELETFTAIRDQLLAGKPLAQPVAPSAKPQEPAKKPMAMMPPGPAPKFTEKEQAQIDLKNREEEVSAANKEVVNARLGAEKVLKYRRQIAELFDLVTKNDVGHPALEGVPLAENLLTMRKTNAQVKKLAEGIINMFSEPGQSQMMNTIVERQMQGAVVPNIFSDPELNKQNAAILRSNVEHLQNFPGFLEKWRKPHNGTLEGAADAWIDYTTNNPLYIYDKNKRGRVKVMENPHVMPWPEWLKQKEQGPVAPESETESRKTRKIGNRTFEQQSDGSWIEIK